MLSVQGLHSSYGKIAALKGVSITVGEGELVAIVGANGAGKTTLLRALSGVQKTTQGRVIFNDVDISSASPRRRVQAGIVQVPEGRQVFAPLSIEDNLRLGAYVRSGPEVEQELESVYVMFPALAERRRLAAGALSGGQQQMLAIGRALMACPKLLLLDEPSMGLAPKLFREIYAHIEILRRGGTTVLLVDQNARAALAIADRAYVLETGIITLEGSGKELAANEAVREAYLGV
ncbi:MAG: ABC transporter ATP-binding protein [Burkholderiaceae bacterium]|nr:ABC transporter ATP-binding protein [Burkholderiaceae bacterium]